MRNVTKPITIKAVYFKDNSEPIRDIEALIMDDFLIILTDDSAKCADWHHISNISRMEGVTMQHYLGMRIGA